MLLHLHSDFDKGINKALKFAMVVVAQLVRASVCGTEGRGFESHLPPKKKSFSILREAFLISTG